MDWRTIKRVREQIEVLGYFVLEVNEDHFKCTHLSDATETFYYIYPAEDGYAVFDGEIRSWVSKDFFEIQHLYKLTPKNTIDSELVDSLVEQWSQSVANDINGKPKTVIVLARLKNGFTIVESSSCVDPDNFDVNIGVECCCERIKSKIWELSGYVLQNVQFLLKEDKEEGEV